MHKGFGFCVMLLTDISETTDASDWLSADFTRCWWGMRWALLGTAGWQTGVWCFADWKAYGVSKNSWVLRNILDVMPKNRIPQILGAGCIEDHAPTWMFLLGTKALAMIVLSAYCVCQAQQQTKIICQILPKSLDFPKWSSSALISCL